MDKIDDTKIISHTGERIITKEDLIKMHNIDENLYEILNFTANVREQAQNKKDWSTAIVQLHQVKAMFKPIHKLVEYQDVLMKLFESKIPVRPSEKEYEWELLAVIPHADIHIDRIEHNPKKYLKEIDDRTLRLFDTLLKNKPDRLLYANIWDYFNSDGNNKTTKWTEMHNSMPERESFQMWLEHQINLVNQLSSELPTDVIYVPWNHDTNKLQYLSDAMNIYYSKTDAVTVDNSLSPRKYYDWGNTKLGFWHGDKIKDKDILSAFTQETKLKKNNVYMKWHIHHRLTQLFWNLIVETFWTPAYPSEFEKRLGYVWRGKIIGQLYDKTTWKYWEFEK